MNFFAMLEDGSVRKIILTQQIVPNIRKIFIDRGAEMLDDVEEIEFDGNYNLDLNEISFVNLLLPDEMTNAVANPLGTLNLDLTNESIRFLFWYEKGTYYFQTFDRRKLLSNHSVLIYDKQTYNQLKEDAFIVDNAVHAIYKDEKFLFKSYAVANRIFSLSEFYKEATNEEILVFAVHPNISIDKDWFTENTNSSIRKQITLLLKSKILDGADTKKIKKFAKGYKLPLELDDKGKIIFPTDKKHCKELLLFLNEQYWTGMISEKQFKTTSKREVK